MEMEFSSLDPDPAAANLKRELSDIVLWNERTSPRSRQQAIGPSEVGNICDRRIAYRIANVTGTNTYSDPWPAIVGTAIHNWLEQAINRFQRETGDRGWLPEVRVQPDEMVQGRSDLFHLPTGTVVDFKTTNADTMKKLKRGEPPSAGYITQINLYGLGHEKAGRRVENVALVYYPRAGWLNDAFVWHAKYDRDIANAALRRLYGIGFKLVDLDIENHPEKFAEIPAIGGDSCVWCPMFNRDLDGDSVASEKGCPGR